MRTAILASVLLAGLAQAGPVDAPELEAFLDGVMAAHKQTHHFAGAVVVVVKDGKVLVQKGYEWADTASKRPVDPEGTLFRIASISKLFTWTAAMQLVEQGKLDLRADVNRYLGKFRVPATFPQPVTMAHLMTHTPGFEDNVIGLFARSEKQMIPLGQLLARDLPERVRPPGQFAAYSNHGSALAGYIVGRLSGMPWERYVEKNILEPLGMVHTSVRQPLPQALDGDMATGYRWAAPEHLKQGFEYVPLAPAGGMSASAGDMARFMIAHLEHGRYGAARILSEAASAQMQQQLFTPARQVNGSLHGFVEMNRNGYRIFGHGGDTVWFHSILALFPDSRTGLFASYNTNTGANARDELLKAFVDRYYPKPDTPAPPPRPGARERARRLAGSYSSMRISHTSPAKMAMLANTSEVSVDKEGRLVTKSSAGAHRWAEVEDFVYRQVDGTETIAFRVDETSGAVYAFRSPYAASMKLTGVATPAFQIGLPIVSMILLISGLVIWPRAAVRIRKKGAARTSAVFAASVSASLLCGTAMLFAVGLGVALRDPEEMVFGIPPLLSRVLLLGPLIAALVVLTAVLGVAARKKSPVRRAGRTHFVLVNAAGAALVWWMWYWNLL